MTEREEKYKAAFMSLLDDYVINTESENVYVDSFCARCLLRKSQAGGCSLGLDINSDWVTCREKNF